MTPASPWLPVGVRPTEPGAYHIEGPLPCPERIVFWRWYESPPGEMFVTWVGLDLEAYMKHGGAPIFDRCRFAPVVRLPLPDQAAEMAEHLDGLRDPGAEVAPAPMATAAELARRAAAALEAESNNRGPFDFAGDLEAAEAVILRALLEGEVPR